MGRQCDYSNAPARASPTELVALAQKVQDLEDRLGSTISTSETVPRSSPTACGTLPKTFPAAFFLDQEAFNIARLTVPKLSTTVPAEVLAAVGSSQDIASMVNHYFASVHVWLPIISKKRLHSQLASQDYISNADFTLLLLTMQLLIEEPSDSSFESRSFYYAAKQYLQTVEAAGLLTLKLIQASILISAYEIGHGIYPAAFLSVGHCVRLGQALGIHDKRTPAPQMISRPGTWAEQEEIRRVWWAVLLLDRHVNLGCPGHPLASEDALKNDVLPSDDGLWDMGEMTASEPIFVSSPTSLKAGAFARTCQVVHLTGRVIRHRDDAALEGSSRFDEALQLYRTIEALGKLLHEECHVAPEKMDISVALCFSTMLALCDSYSCTENIRGDHAAGETEIQSTAIQTLKTVAAEVLTFSYRITQMMRDNWAASSPLIIDCICKLLPYLLLVKQCRFSRNANEVGADKKTMA
ncbi:MAG: hypothetical protein Q9160_006836 [Pyrenula sp. 1 TL-2023]